MIDFGDLFLPALLLAGVYFLYRYLTVPSAWRRCVSPPCLPVLGNVHMCMDPRGVLDTAMGFAKESPMGIGLWFGPFEMQYMTYHPDTVKIVLKANTPKNFFYDFLHPWLGTGLLTASGSKWKSRRVMLTPAFHFEILRSYHDVFCEHAGILLDKWSVNGDGDLGDGISVKAERDVFRDVTLCTLDVICDAAMGVKLDAQGGSSKVYVDAIVVASRSVYRRMVNPLLWSDWVHALTPYGWAAAAAVKTLKDHTRTVIHKRQETLIAEQKEPKLSSSSGVASGKKKPYGRHLDFLDLLLSARDDNGEMLSDDDIQEEVDTFMFEGHDTTATAISFTLLCLAQDKAAQERARREVDQVLGSRPHPRSEDLASLPFVWACIREAMRLYPSVPMMGRKLTEPTEVDGVVLPPGTQLNVIPYVLHRNPAVWDKPDEFVPTRFLVDDDDDDSNNTKNDDEKTKKRSHDPFAFVPFSAGPRNCIGQKFASTEMKILVASILKRFTLDVGTHPPVVLRPEVILRPENGIHLIVKERK